jgi:hypothetical protein
MYFGFDTPYQLRLPDSANGSGRVWLGNFGSTSFSSVNAAVGGGSGMNESLLNTFNPLASFGIDSDGFFNGNGVSGAIGSYNASTYLYSGQVALNAFAGQDAYLLVLNSSSNVWDTAKADWAASGSPAASILVKSGSSFDSEAGESSSSNIPGPKYYSVSPQSGTLMLGYFNADNTMTATTVPEPSVGALLLLGGGALALIRARRNRE